MSTINMCSDICYKMSNDLREITLDGDEIEKRLSDNQMQPDKSLFCMNKLNFIKITNSELKSLPKEIVTLAELHTLIVTNHQFETLPGNKSI